MIKLLIHRVTLPLVAALAALPSFAATDLLDRVVAVVDEDVVMSSELVSQIDQIKQQMEGRTQLPPEEELREQILEHLIIKRLQLALGERMGVEVSDAQVNDTINRMQAANQMTSQQFQQQLAQDGLTINGLRHQLREELIVQQVQKARVNYRIQISEQEIDNFLNSEEGKFWLSPEYQLGHILVPFSGNGRDEDMAQTQAKAASIFDQLRAGSDFRALAVAHSAGQNALQGGDMGWRKAVELPELFADQLTDAKIGMVTEPFASGAGFHILTVYDRRGAEETVIQQAKVRHILLTPSEILTDEEAYNQLVEFREQILAGTATFEELAREHSEDIGSMLAGGDLGWSLPGKFVPEFEKMMNNTLTGEISPPFRSQFGWHMLKVDDRRDENMTETVVRNQAANLLRSRRFNEELEIWLQELRAQAYVENRLTRN